MVKALCVVGDGKWLRENFILWNIVDGEDLFDLFEKLILIQNKIFFSQL